jgi:excisionase family DNA binding protein
MPKPLEKPKEKKTQGIRNPSGYEVKPRLYDLGMAACYLGRSVYSMRTLIWNGEIPVVKSGKKIWIDVSDLNDWITRHKTREADTRLHIAGA